MGACLPQGVLECQLPQTWAEGQNDQEAAHAQVLQVQLLVNSVRMVMSPPTHLKLFEAAILVHDVQHGDLEAVQPLLEVGHLVLEGVQVLLGHGLLQPGVAVAVGAVDLESQAL